MNLGEIRRASIKQPSSEQLRALRIFAKSRGRNWKCQLNDCWMTGNYGFADDSMNLQQVRNEFGPSWLVKFRLNLA